MVLTQFLMRHEPGLVYESPDGGNTVYARQVGSNERTLVHQSPAVHLNNRYHKWRDILNLASEYPALDRAVSEAELIYEIVKKEN